MLGVVKTMTNSTNAGVIAIAVCLLVGCVLTFALPAKAVNPK
jgi:MFS-type transporter involved in bile tolerance (Atg22 family)